MSTSLSADLPTTAELDTIFAETKNWGRWGDDDERGSINHLTPECTASAAALVTDGVSLSLAYEVATTPTPACPMPAHHHMLASGDALDANGIPGYEATRDHLATDIHGLGLTHIDALCHMFVAGEMYNGRAADCVKSTGAECNDITAIGDGVVGRGVLLDVPRSRGEDFIDPSYLVRRSDLEAAEADCGVEVRTGDLLVVSTGRHRRRDSLGGDPNPLVDGLAGLHPDCLPWLSEREIALLGSDGISDPMPPTPIADWPFPIHQIGIVGMGLFLIDNLDLSGLSVECTERGRWEFLLVVAPLRLPGGTGSPLNPIAIF